MFEEHQKLKFISYAWRLLISKYIPDCSFKVRGYGPFAKNKIRIKVICDRKDLCNLSDTNDKIKESYKNRLYHLSNIIHKFIGVYHVL